MARGRMLNKTVTLSTKFQMLPDDTCRLMATWIIPNLDVRGVFYADPAVVRSLIFPMREDITTLQIEHYLKAMAATGLVRLWKCDGRMWQVWDGFTDNQAGLRTDRETTDFPEPPPLTGAPRENAGENPQKDAASIPPSAGIFPPPAGISPPLAGNPRENSREKPAEVNLKLNEVKLSEVKVSASPPPEIVPESPDKQTEIEKPRPRDLLFDAIAEATSSDVQLLGSRIGKVTAEFRKINATPDQVRKVAAWYAANDWRGKKGEKLTFEILKEIWGQGLKGAPIIAQPPGKTARRPQVPEYTESQRAAMAVQSAQRNNARDAGRTDRLQAQLTIARADRENAAQRKDANAVTYFDQQIASLEGKLTTERTSA